MADDWDTDVSAAPADSWGGVKPPGGRGRGISIGLTNQMRNLKVLSDDDLELSKLPPHKSTVPTNPDLDSGWGLGWKSAPAASNPDDWGDGSPGQFTDAQEELSSRGLGSTATQKPVSSIVWGRDDDQPRGGGWESSNRGGRGGLDQGGGWGSSSHIAKGNHSVKRHNSNEEGHMTRNCPKQKAGGGSKGCYNCGEEGHMSRECPNPKEGGNRSRACRNCGEEGHMARDCRNKGDEGGSSGISSNLSCKCYNCGQEGHQSRDCDQPRKPREGGSGVGGACFRCQSTGHMAKDCPQGDVGPDSKPREVYIPPDIQDDELFHNGISTGHNFANFDNIALQVTGSNVPNYITSFETAGLRDLVLRNIRNSGYTKPTPVQKGSIAVILARRDLIASAVTGSGKTAAYLIPVINILLEKQVQGASYATTQKPEVVIISPTRELAIQIHREARKFAHNSVLKTVILYGGTQVSHQRNNITSGCNILVATPGRLKDFIDKEIVDFSNLQFFILDEADRMLDMGFGAEIEKIATHPTMPLVGKRITLMFSATFPHNVQGLAQKYLHDYIFVTTGTIGGINPDVCQDFHEVPRSEKRNKLVEILRDLGTTRVMVFVESKKTADFIAAFLANSQFEATSIHGDRLQSQRETALREFKAGIRNILVATNVAARGLDIAGVECVINYDLPADIEEYVHRIGRTGRVGNVGRSISFYDPGRDGDKACALVEKLSASHADVPSFLQSAISGIGGMGYSFNAPSSSANGFRSIDARRFGNNAGFVDKPAETEECWE